MVWKGCFSGQQWNKRGEWEAVYPRFPLWCEVKNWLTTFPGREEVLNSHKTLRSWKTIFLVLALVEVTLSRKKETILPPQVHLVSVSPRVVHTLLYCREEFCSQAFLKSKSCQEWDHRAVTWCVGGAHIPVGDTWRCVSHSEWCAMSSQMPGGSP